MADFVCKASPCPYDAPGGPLVGPPLGNSAAQRVRISERTLLEAVLWFSMVFEMPVLENALLKRHGADLWSPRTMPLKKAAGEGVDSLGGFLVPENITSAIIQFRQVAGVLRRESTVWPMHRGDLLNVPRRSSGFATSFVGENGTLTETSLQFDSVALSPKKLAGYVRLSTEVNQDMAASWSLFCLQEFGNSIGLKEDQAGLNGDGTSQWGGIRGVNTIMVDGNHGAGVANCAAGHHGASTIDTTDMAALLGTLPEQYWPNAKLYMSGPMFGLGLCRLQGLSGAAVTVGATNYYNGIEVVLCPAMPGSGS